MQTVLDSFFAQLEVGPPKAVGGVALLPLFNHGPPGPRYILLDEAIAANQASVEEKGAGGSVPLLVLVNKSESYVLALQGDELVGGKQNRVLNISVLVAPKSVVDLPVSCVEQGRWHPVSRAFAPSEKAFPKLRRELDDQVASSLRATGSARSNQGAVWASVQAELSDAGAESPTYAMRDAYERRSAAMSALQEGLPYVEGASGLVATVAGKLSLAEVYDRPEACRRTWPRLVRSLAFEAAAGSGEATKEAVRDLLLAARNARAESFPSPGAGTAVQIAGPELSGSALVVEGTVVHCSLFGRGAP